MKKMQKGKIYSNCCMFAAFDHPTAVIVINTGYNMSCRMITWKADVLEAAAVVMYRLEVVDQPGEQCAAMIVSA